MKTIHKIHVDVSWSGDNFGCVWSDGDAGAVVVTDRKLSRLDRSISYGDMLREAGQTEDYIDYIERQLRLELAVANCHA